MRFATYVKEVTNLVIILWKHVDFGKFIDFFVPNITIFAKLWKLEKLTK